MVFYGEMSDPASEDEFIYVNKDEKHEDDEMQMLTPILLDSMFDLRAPPDIFRVLKNVDKADDATEVTTASFSDLLIPNFDTPPTTPPDFTTAGFCDDDDASEISEDSYHRGERSSPRNVVSPRNATSYPFRIPADVRYDGQVLFSVSRTPRQIHLQPRQSARARTIFVPKSYNDFAYYGEFALADSISSNENGNGAEECKCEEEEPKASYDEGFAYVYGERFREDEYWGDYDGHYGSRDFDEDQTETADYALEHSSVQGDDIEATGTYKAPRYHGFGAPSHEDRSILDEVTDMFSLCFGCTGTFYSVAFSSRASSPRFPSHSKNGFEAADYGVSKDEHDIM